MLRIKLAAEIRKVLLERHKTIRDKREADRIKAVLLSDDGWTNAMIAKALFLCQETVHDHLTDYVEEQKLKPENGGSSSKLSDAQASELIRHLEENTYVKVKAICSYVETKYGIIYTVAGMTKWLHEHRFSYKKPKPTPAKADAAKQAEFIAEYERLKAERPSNEPIVFIDAVHPTMATKTTEGWIRTGKDKLIPTTASRTRINIVGALNLETMDLVTQSYKTVNSVSMSSFFEVLRSHYPDAPKIHVISDRGPYNISHVTKAAAAKNNICFALSANI